MCVQQDMHMSEKTCALPQKCACRMQGASLVFNIINIFNHGCDGYIFLRIDCPLSNQY